MQPGSRTLVIKAILWYYIPFAILSAAFYYFLALMEQAIYRTIKQEAAVAFVILGFVIINIQLIFKLNKKC